ncbi:MAG: two-component system, OmpR family, sensor histidine kinase KdpD [Actinomycetota bacterium]|jgi:two-component system sensor histidine kinase KdpD|nr:two-component system, OmpR family, sensor histidine kinase KdpD [Actinomycetota bacterium]
MAREARVVGLRGVETPSLAAVERRRSQLWAVALLVMAGLAAGAVLLSLSPDFLKAHSLISLGGVRFAMFGLTIAFGLYVVDKEVHLRRLSRLLVDERVISTALSNRVREMAALSAAGQAMNSVLALEETLDIILGSALELLDADAGAVLLAEGDEKVRVVSSRGESGYSQDERVELGEGTVGTVVTSRVPRLLHEDEGSVLCVPLVSRGNVLGALLVRSRPPARFVEYDQRVLTLFAEHAASAVANASLYEAERDHVAELLELNHLKSSFVAMVSHELRAPLASIIGATRTLQRSDVPPHHVERLLELIEEQSGRLNKLVEEVLEVKKAEVGADIACAPIDLAQIVYQVARLSRMAGRPVEVDVSGPLMANADPTAIEQILFNFVDNAFTHAWGTVEVHGSVLGEEVCLSVLDRGQGVPPEAVAAVFDPFRRLDAGGAPGAGLGLYLARMLAEAQGGTVTVSARPGGGADFSVRLPTLNAVPVR